MQAILSMKEKQSSSYFQRFIVELARKCLRFFFNFPRTVTKVLEVSMLREYEFLSNNNKIMDMDVDRESEMNLSCKELRVLLFHEFHLGHKATEATSDICSRMYSPFVLHNIDSIGSRIVI